MATCSSTDTPSLSVTRLLSLKVLTNLKKATLFILIIEIHSESVELYIILSVLCLCYSFSSLIRANAIGSDSGVSDPEVFLFSLVDTKETITIVKAAAFLHIMSWLKDRSIYKHIKM